MKQVRKMKIMYECTFVVQLSVDFYIKNLFLKSASLRLWDEE